MQLAPDTMHCVYPSLHEIFALYPLLFPSFLAYVKQEWPDNKAQTLTVSDFGVVETVRLDNIEQCLLSDAICLEVLMVREGAAHVARNLLFMCASGLQQLCISSLQLGIL